MIPHVNYRRRKVPQSRCGFLTTSFAFRELGESLRIYLRVPGWPWYLFSTREGLRTPDRGKQNCEQEPVTVVEQVSDLNCLGDEVDPPMQ